MGLGPVVPGQTQVGVEAAEGGGRLDAQLLVGADHPGRMGGHRLFEGGGEQPDTPDGPFQLVGAGQRDAPPGGQLTHPRLVFEGDVLVHEVESQPAGQHAARVTEHHHHVDVELGGQPLDGQRGVHRLDQQAGGRRRGAADHRGWRPSRPATVIFIEPCPRRKLFSSGVPYAAEDLVGQPETGSLGSPVEDPGPQLAVMVGPITRHQHRKPSCRAAWPRWPRPGAARCPVP